ncbi:hypothetical protein SDC9_55065 [bioreactor metagenome]|uniref:Uncharacterized protein n=1 Tax=bioreactor metagenome TaxID=1076179 RepID=A0A644WYT0_9ZZZZ
MPFLIFAHVDTDQTVFVVEHVFGQSPRQFCFSNTCGAEKNERADGSFLIAESAAAPADGVTDCFDGCILTYNPLVQFFFEMEQLFFFALQHPA